MLTNDLINNNLPFLSLTDSISKAIILTTDFKLKNIPVVNNKIFIGLVNESDLLDAPDENQPISSLQPSFKFLNVKNTDHFLIAVSLCTQANIQIIPVLNSENEFLGSISSEDLLKELSDFNGSNQPGSIIVFEVDIVHFSISEISRLVESNDSTILHLNTKPNHETQQLTVTLHINNQDSSSIVSTFERYNYNVIYFNGSEDLENKIQDNYQHLMNYLAI
ncbi:MAG: CBS domain-containing protein [Ferruginibacter sp.]